MITCSICLNIVGKRKCKTECGHSFHYKCIYKWILNNDNCPLCRTVIRNPEDDEEVRMQRFVDFFFIITDIIARGRD